MNRKPVFIFLAVLFVVLAGGTFLYLNRPARGINKRPQIAGICPECGQKFPRTAEECPFCRYKHAAERSIGAGAAPRRVSAATKLGIGFGVIAIGVLIVNWGQLRRIMRERRRKRDQLFMWMNCANCKRRLRYLATSAGKQGLCPKCGGICNFPAVQGIGAGVDTPRAAASSK
jgi:hypothetical protein